MVTRDVFQVLKFLGLKTFLDDIEIPKPKKTFWPYEHLKTFLI